MITRLPLPFSPPHVGSLLTLPGRLLPNRLHSQGLTLLLNRLLSEPLANGELDFLQDRVLQIEVMDLALDYRLTLRDGKLAAAPAQNAPDVRFGGKAREFLLLALNEEDPDTLFFQRRLQLEGDTELGLEIKNLLYSLDEDLLPDPLHRVASKVAGILKTD
ncbi:ubiquinone anaerobic biosynthesis accessory factor UbiT [Thiolapillus sp.]